MIKVTIERIETVWEKQRNWKQMHNDPQLPDQYKYVDAELPATHTTRLLEQSLEDIDIPAVIKAINKL